MDPKEFVISRKIFVTFTFIRDGLSVSRKIQQRLTNYMFILQVEARFHEKFKKETLRKWFEHLLKVHIKLSTFFNRFHEKIVATNIFRQINHLVISLVKPLLLRNFCERSVKRETISGISTLWYGKYSYDL